MATHKLLLIRGLGHSGTTILDLALGAHPRMLGLGEAVRILQRPAPGDEQRGPARLRADLRHQRRCTCGSTAADCPVWGEMLEWLPAHDHLPLVDKVLRLLKAVERHASMQSRILDWVVDSYQDDLDMPLVQHPDLEIRIVFLVRDLRSWTYSRSKEARRQGASWAGIVPVARWSRVNRRFERELQRCAKPVLILGYEELALAPQKALGLLCHWLGLDVVPGMFTPGPSSSSHILAGNRLRFDSRRNGQIRYDAEWMMASSWPAGMALLWPPVARMNQRLVYGNGVLRR